MKNMQEKFKIGKKNPHGINTGKEKHKESNLAQGISTWKLDWTVTRQSGEGNRGVCTLGRAIN